MSWNLSPRALRAGIAGAAVTLVCATAWWATRPGISHLPAQALAPGFSWQSTPMAAIDPEHGLTQRARDVSVEAVAATPASEAPDSEVATVAQYTDGKYRLLLDDLRGLRAEDIERLRRDLLTRELLAGSIKAAREADDPAGAGEMRRQQAALVKVEGQIRDRLHPADHAMYQALKDADLELFQLDDYAGGISSVAPLGAADRNAILKTKLACKARFQQMLQDSGLMRDDLSAAEREYAYRMASHALEDYRRCYLQEVRQLLADDEQYSMLSHYENTEFKAELAKLEVVVSGTR